MILTSDIERNRAQVESIKATWSARCDEVLFVSNRTDRSLPSITVCDDDRYDHLWCKVVKSFHYVYSIHGDVFDWFLKADDDSYFVLENLRALLGPYDSADPVFFGYAMRFPNPEIFYMSGGAGYVLSREALARFVAVTNANEEYVLPPDRELDYPTDVSKLLLSIVSPGADFEKETDDVKAFLRPAPTFSRTLGSSGPLSETDLGTLGPLGSVSESGFGSQEEPSFGPRKESKISQRLFTDLSGDVKHEFDELVGDIGPECNNTWSDIPEDLLMGYCLSRAGVRAGDSRDALGKQRFFPSKPRDFMSPFLPVDVAMPWIETYSKYPVRQVSCMHLFLKSI